jgi:predicted Zn-dependent peptidase
MCKDEVYAVKKYGTVGDVEGITEASLYEAYLNALKSCKLEIYVTGECEIDKVSAIFDAYISELERDVKLPRKYPIVRTAAEVKRVDEVQDINQGKLCIGFRIGCNVDDENFYIARLFSEIFGSGDVSKLFMNVREKMSLCYSIDSVLFQRIGILMVTAGIEFENKEIAEKAIFDQLEAMRSGDITEDEFLSAKRSLCNVFMQVYDSPRVMEKWTLNRTFSDSTLTPIEECTRIENATPEDVIEFAKRIALDTVYFLKGENADG